MNEENWIVSKFIVKIIIIINKSVQKHQQVHVKEVQESMF